VSPASADPTEIEYDVFLDFFITDGAGAFDIEGHFATVLFDELFDPLPNDFVPIAPFLPGNDLIVTEEVIDGGDGTETITIWIEAEVLGDPLFVNVLDPAQPVVFNVIGLHWDDPSMGGIVSDIEVLVTFPDDEFLVPVLDEFVFGLGTPTNPLDVFLTLDPFHFYDPFGDPDGIKATDLHLSFTVEHFLVIPEPSSFALAGLAIVGLLSYRRRRV